VRGGREEREVFSHSVFSGLTESSERVASEGALSAGESPPCFAATAGVCEFSGPFSEEPVGVGHSPQVRTEQAEAVPVGENGVGDADFSDGAGEAFEVLESLLK